MSGPVAALGAGRFEDLADVRSRLLNLILRASLFMGLVIYFPSVFLVLRTGLYGLALIDTVAVGVVVALYRFESLAFGTRAAAICATYYVLALGLLIQVGSTGQLFLIGFSIVTVLLFGLRIGLAAAALSSLTLFVVASLGYASPGLGIPSLDRDVVRSLVVAINFALIDFLLVLAAGVLLDTVDSALRHAVASASSLGNERNFLRTLVNTLPDLVFTKDTSGRFVTCNSATLALFGVEREDQVAGKTVFQLFPHDVAAPYHDDDLAVLAGVPVTNREERSVGADGRDIWYLTNKVPLYDLSGAVVGLLGTSRDVTDRRRLLTELQVQVERMPLAYLLTDADLRYVRWNPAAERMFGYSAAEMMGKTPFDSIVVETPTSSVATVLHKIREGTFAVHIEAEHRTKDGRTVVCKWHNTPMFGESGAFVGLLALGEDVSARVLLEAQLRQSQKMEAVGRLAGGVAHDFNNLLSVVLSYSELVLDDLAAGDPMRENVEGIRDAGLRAADLTRQLLLFSRRQVVQPRVLDPGALLGGIEKMLRRLLGADIELAFVRDPSMGRISADAGSIEQVIVNLAVNARDAMPDGGKLTIETRSVTLDELFVTTHAGAVAGNYVLLSVADSGAGMDKATLARIFEPFFTTKEQGKGTGLGLSTVFGIVQQSNGTVWVQSEPGVGTTFEIYLPRVGGDVDRRLGERPRTEPRGSETILLVEDEPAARAASLRILRGRGYTVLEAPGGAEAIELSRAHAGAIDLLLTDVVMPKMSGPVLASLLSPTRPHMKVLCMSGYTGDATLRQGFAEGGFAFLQKPLTIATLTQGVRDALDAKRRVPV